MFLHGLESGPHGSKYRALLSRGEVEAPDFRDYPTLEERIVVAEAATRGRTGLFLIGSSFGGLLATVMYQRYPDRISRYLLLAPALHQPAAQEVGTVPGQAMIIHGVADDIVPISASRDFANRFKVPLFEVDDGHRLSSSMSQILAAVDTLQRS